MTESTIYEQKKKKKTRTNIYERVKKDKENHMTHNPYGYYIINTSAMIKNPLPIMTKRKKNIKLPKKLIRFRYSYLIIRRAKWQRKWEKNFISREK